MGYTYIDSAGDSDGTSMWLFLYPFRDGDNTELENEIADATINMCGEFLERDEVDHYGILRYTETVIGDDNYGLDYFNFNSFSDWIDDHQPYLGCHMAVTDETNMASATIVGIDESAWVAQAHAYVGTDGGYQVGNSDQARYSNLAIQEPLHEWIVPDYDYVDNMVDGDLPDDHRAEHELGRIYSLSDPGPSSPMITFYEHGNAHPTSDRDCSRKGDCKMGEYAKGWSGNHSQTMTSCTLKAAEYSAGQEL